MHTLKGMLNNEINELLEITLHVGNISSCIYPSWFSKEVFFLTLNFNRLYLHSHHIIIVFKTFFSFEEQWKTKISGFEYFYKRC